MSQVMKSLTPNIMVDDIQKTVKFYTDILGFEFVDAVPSKDTADWAMLKCHHVILMFQVRDNVASEYPILAQKPIGGSLIFYIVMNNLDNFYEKIKDKVKIVSVPHDTHYEKREFAIEDCNGYILTFAQEINPELISIT